jgi:hypothetical protein
MKKTMLLSLLSVSAAIVVSTNVNAQKGFYISAQGGPQLSVSLNRTDMDKQGMDYKSKSSYMAGIGAGYNFTRHLGVSTELMYSVERQRYQDNTIGYTQKLKYLKVPLLFNVSTSPGANVSFIVKAGPQLGILMNSAITDATGSSQEGINKDRYNKLTYGAMFGGGARVRLTNNLYADAGLRFDGTFKNVENEKYLNSVAARTKTHNLNAGIDVGVKYFLN